MALVSFDLDGVLQRNPFHGRSPHGVFGHIARELAPYIPDCSDPRAAVNTALDMVLGEQQTRMHAGKLVDAHDWDGIVAMVARQLNYPHRLSVTELVEQYCTRPGLVYLYPGARDCLEALKAAGHTLVAITNGFTCYQAPVLRTLGVLDLFTELVSPEKAGAAKPELGIFRAAEAYGPGPYIHIGDTLPHDVAGAKRAGWLAIYVVQSGAPGATELPADLTALAPWERPAHGRDWLRFRLDIDRRWHGYPPAELEECTPDAIVAQLREAPETVAQLVSSARA